MEWGRELTMLARLRSRTAETVEVGPGVGKARPRLALPAAGGPAPRAVAVMLHGGLVDGLDPLGDVDVSAALVQLWTGQLRKRVPEVAFVRVVNAVTGWNDPIKSPVADADWALMRVRQLYPDLPIALVGHSMGGRTAFELVDRPGVRAIVGLAPWLADGYIEQRFLKTPTLLVHGRQDTETSPEASQDLVERIRDAGGDARFESVAGWHSLLLRASVWQREVADFLRGSLVGP